MADKKKSKGGNFPFSKKQEDARDSDNKGHKKPAKKKGKK
jgi:hypothetical protein